MFALVLGTLLIAQGPTPSDPGALVEAAERAVAEGDTILFRRQWSGDGPTDRFATALIDQLQYRTDVATPVFAELAARSPVDALAGWSQLRLAEIVAAEGHFTRADSLFEVTRQTGVQLRDGGLAFYARLARAVLRVRLVGPAQSVAVFDSLERDVPDMLRFQGRMTCSHGQLYAQLGQHEGARRRLALGVQQAREGGDLRGEASCEFALGSSWANVGASDSGMAHFMAAGRLAESAGDYGRWAASLQSAGWVALSADDYQGANQLLRLAVAHAKHSRSDLVLGWASLNLAQLATKLNDFRTAAQQFELASGYFDQIGDSLGLRTAQASRAAMLVNAGEHEAAVAAYEDLIGWADRSGFANFAVFYREGFLTALARLGHLEQATTVLADADLLAQRNGMRGWEPVLDQHRAELALLSGRLAQADSLLQLNETRYETQPNTLYDVALLRAYVAMRRGHLDEAVSRVFAASTYIDSVRARLRGSSLVRFVLQNGGLDRGSEQILADLVAVLGDSARHEDVLVLTEQTRARELQDQLVASTVLDEREGAIALGRGPATGGIADIQRAFPDAQTAIVAFYSGPLRSSSSVLIVSRDSVVTVRLPPLADVSPAIADLNSLLQGGGPIGSAAQQVAGHFVAPWINSVPPNVSSLIIVPDGDLFHVPFEVLPTIDGMLIDRFNVSYSPSVRVAAAQWAKRDEVRGGARILAIGDPVYDDVSTGEIAVTLREAFEETGGLGRLRYARSEARRVASRGEGTLYVGAEATESRLKASDLQDYDVIHIAAHALVDHGTAFRTALALTPDGSEDGFLRMDELAQLNVNASLVFLSACRTAGGSVLKGEGLIGLTASLLQAGAGAVLGTRWLVPDREMRRVVDLYYDRLAAGLTLGEALRETQVQLRTEGADPRLWAGLTLVGDAGVTISVKRRPWWRFW